MITNSHFSILFLVTVGAYFVAAAGQGLCLAGKVQRCRPGFWVLGLAAVACHGVLLYHWIDIVNGQNLSAFNVLSMVTWLVSIIVMLTSLAKPVENLIVYIYPIAILSLFVAHFFPSVNILNTDAKPFELSHILLSILALSVMCVAAGQALLLGLLERRLRSSPSARLLKVLPPMDTMESLLFQFIGLGFLLLTVVLISSTIFFQHIFAHHMLHKTILAFVAWAVFAILLLGRWLGGWRGAIAIGWTWLGVVILILCCLIFAVPA